MVQAFGIDRPRMLGALTCVPYVPHTQKFQGHACVQQRPCPPGAGAQACGHGGRVQGLGRLLQEVEDSQVTGRKENLGFEGIGRQKICKTVTPEHTYAHTDTQSHPKSLLQPASQDFRGVAHKTVDTGRGVPNG